MFKLVLGNKNYSSWSMRPWLALKKAGIEFEEIVIALYQDDYRQALKPYSPSGKVPVLIAGEIQIWDSLAICEYAAEITPALWPQDQLPRAKARSISHEMHSGFGLIRTTMPMNCRSQNRQVEITDATQSEINRIEAIWTDCFENQINQGPWLFGEFTIADAMYAPIVSRFNTYGISLNQTCSEYIQRVLDDPHVGQWYKAAQQEPYVIQASEVGN